MSARAKDRRNKVRANKGDNRPRCKYCNEPLGVHSIGLGVCCLCDKNRRESELKVIYLEEEDEEELEDGMIRDGQTYYYLRGLKEVAASKGMNMLQISELTPYPYGTLKNWSCFTNAAPLYKIEVLADCIGVSVRRLIGDES